MILETGTPDFSGLYVVRLWHGYRILQWTGERWEHPGAGCFPWPGNDALIEGWAGPLPALAPMPIVNASPPAWEPVDEMGDPVRLASPMEYDL